VNTGPNRTLTNKGTIEQSERAGKIDNQYSEGSPVG